MEISYYLNPDGNGLHCRLSDGKHVESCFIGHNIDRAEWKCERDIPSYDYRYDIALHYFKTYLSQRFAELAHKGEKSALANLREEIDSMVKDEGIKGIARKMFNNLNGKDDVPSFDLFIQAFEKFSGLSGDAYEVRIVDSRIEFITKSEDYVIDTYEGLTARLESMINQRRYGEIEVATDEGLWSAVYLDAGIEKHVFLPKMLFEWECYWNAKYNGAQKRNEKTGHLDEIKAVSWRALVTFMQCYDVAGDIIELAVELDSSKLYPMAVIAMLSVFDANCCYLEYCEYEFNGDDWEAIDLAEDQEDSDIFYVRVKE